MSTAPLPKDQWPDLSDVVTEDDEPVDNVFSEKQQRLLTNPLLDCWSGPATLKGKRRPFLAMANVGLFFAVGQPPLVPDALLSVDVEQLADPFPKAGRSYFVWVYGKVPNVVIEVVSNREGGELSEKLRKYERIGVPHYIVFDPEELLSDHLVHGFKLVGGTYVTDDSMRFESVGLQLVRWHGVFERMPGDWLRWALLDGTPIPTAGEEKQRAEQEKQRAEQEKQRAEQEKQRAEQEKQRANRLAERLRALGVDPDDP